MKFSKKRLELIEKLAIVGGIFLALFIVGYYTGYIKTNCKLDKACFDEALKKCRSSQFIYVDDNNVYSYEAWPGVGDGCFVKITLERVQAGASLDFKNLEGKSMKCKLTKTQLKETSIEQFDNFIKYCHGELKEGIYEIIIQRIYSNIVSNLGDVIQEAQKVLGK